MLQKTMLVKKAGQLLPFSGLTGFAGTTIKLIWLN